MGGDSRQTEESAPGGQARDLGIEPQDWGVVGTSQDWGHIPEFTAESNSERILK